MYIGDVNIIWARVFARAECVINKLFDSFESVILWRHVYRHANAAADNLEGDTRLALRCVGVVALDARARPVAGPSSSCEFHQTFISST